jgi:hypothetical protein
MSQQSPPSTLPCTVKLQAETNLYFPGDSYMQSSRPPRLDQTSMVPVKSVATCVKSTPANLHHMLRHPPAYTEHNQASTRTSTKYATHPFKLLPSNARGEAVFRNKLSTENESSARGISQCRKKFEPESLSDLEPYSPQALLTAT